MQADMKIKYGINLDLYREVVYPFYVVLAKKILASSLGMQKISYSQKVAHDLLWSKATTLICMSPTVKNNKIAVCLNHNFMAVKGTKSSENKIQNYKEVYTLINLIGKIV